ncbi:hypothetical protein CGMCC3_g6242 [Colletotrichum fructicola]|nr:uncharacterized protein CGMCC3_g6242 [Colletotrichum fructicola]KAE9577689.1 hypothetical protein CGMCC3_g6242 [Colletotrichum fructicola]
MDFVSSDSEVEEDNAEQARADEYLRGWHDRRKDIKEWAEAAPMGTQAVPSYPAKLHTGIKQAGLRESDVPSKLDNSNPQPSRCSKRKRSASDEDYQETSFGLNEDNRQQTAAGTTVFRTTKYMQAQLVVCSDASGEESIASNTGRHYGSAQPKEQGM